MNPFDDDNGIFHVLRNAEEQYSIWPTFLDVPSGWSVELSEVSREEALRYVDEHWTDILPRSVRDKLSAVRNRPDDNNHQSA